MSKTLNEIIVDLEAKTITITGATAELTRQEYYDRYSDYINTPQYVPIFYFNIVENSVYLNNTSEIQFNDSDLFTANDWICLNSNE